MVSKCCNAEIVRHHGKYHPDNSDFYIAESWEACSKCSEPWPEQVEACEHCGEGSEVLVDTRLGKYCTECVILTSEELMEREGTH